VGDLMNRKKITWFGIFLTQKQSVIIFILSIIGVFISVFFLFTMVSSLMMNLMYYDPYYYPDNYMLQMVFSILPYAIIFGVTCLLGLYSLVQCRKIAKYYSPLINSPVETTPVPRYTEVKQSSFAQFCPNCGKTMKDHEKFCTNCGREVPF